MNLRPLPPIVAAFLASSAPAQTLLKGSPIHGVFESYFYSTRLDRGVDHKLSWGEFYARPTHDTKVVYSFGEFPGGHITDEAYASYEKNAFYVRAGRMRTTFGFNDWASLYYNGFNALPYVWSVSLGDGIPLMRQDSGVEATTSFGDLQVEVAAFDGSLRRDQITPDDVDNGIVRLQAPLGPFILGLDALQNLRHDRGVYGFDLRYTAPRLIGRMELYGGAGPGSGNGGYADVQYRLPKLLRTQAVGRVEYVRQPGFAGVRSRYTLGIRQVFCNYFNLNVNYAWGVHLLNEPFFPAAGTDNWSARLGFQIHF